MRKSYVLCMFTPSLNIIIDLPAFSSTTEPDQEQNKLGKRHSAVPQKNRGQEFKAKIKCLRSFLVLLSRRRKEKILTKEGCS